MSLGLVQEGEISLGYPHVHHIWTNALTREQGRPAQDVPSLAGRTNNGAWISSRPPLIHSYCSSFLTRLEGLSRTMARNKDTGEPLCGAWVHYMLDEEDTT